MIDESSEYKKQQHSAIQTPFIDEEKHAHNILTMA